MITVTIQDCTEAQHTTTAISSTRFQNTSPLSSIISVGTCSSLHTTTWREMTEDIGVIAENKEKYISFNVKIDVQLEIGWHICDKEDRVAVH